MPAPPWWASLLSSILTSWPFWIFVAIVIGLCMFSRRSANG